MTAGIVAVVVLLVGLPLGAFWLGGRRFWGRLRPRTLWADRQGALYREMVLRHRLRPAEAARVESAVTWGRRLEQPRLRAAVVDWAETQRAAVADRRKAQPRARRALLGVALLVCLAGVAVLLVQDRHSTRMLLQTVLWGLLWGGFGAWAATGPRRAIRLNRDRPPAPGSTGLLGE